MADEPEFGRVFSDEESRFYADRVLNTRPIAARKIEIEAFGTKRVLQLTMSTTNLVIPIQGEGLVNFRDSGQRNAEGIEIWTRQAPLHKCDYLHCHFSDDWSRCPYPELVKVYDVIAEDGTVSTSYFCDDAAEQARGDGLNLRAALTVLQDD